ncbi:MAG: DUF922 domain-containing protein [Bacteroidota bacterium]
MLYLKYLLAALFIFTLSSDSDRMAWDKDQKIKWADFQGKAQSNNLLDAYSMLGISLEVIGQSNGEVEMGVFGYFEKNKSWVKPGEQSDHLLLHEQKHFDICEVYRRKLVQRLEAAKHFSYDDFSDQVSSIFNELFEEYKKEQERYDQATNHSQKKEEQAKWNKYIAEELLRLKKYDKLSAVLKVE